MAIQVTNLKINVQSGTTDTLYASWSFNTSKTTTTTASSSIKAGATVSIKSSATTYYNGVTIPDWVKTKKWIVLSVSGDRVVINKDAGGEGYAICSAIKASNLSLSSSSSSTTTTVSNLDYYLVKWTYMTADKVWFTLTEANVTDAKNHICSSVPANATTVKVTVKPVSKKRDVNGKSKSYWTGTAVGAYFVISRGVPEQPSAPSIKIDKYTLTATLEDITDSKADQIEFYVVKGDKKFKTGIVDVKTQRAIFTCPVTAGAKYRVKCRAINVITTSNKSTGEWSSYSSEEASIPVAVTDVKCAADTKTSIQLTWTGNEAATSYTVEYTTNKLYFDSASEVNSTSVTNTTAYITGLDSGDEWFFRVRASNADGDSDWSDIVSCVIGTKPAAPTTWSLTTTAVLGDSVTLYWVHNSEDGSKQTGAQIELNINGVESTVPITTTPKEDEEEKSYSYTLDLSAYSAGAKVLWRVRTKGATDEYSDWSIQRTIDIYAPPTLELELDTDSTDEILSNFPCIITAVAGPATQVPMGYHVSITADETYETSDFTGENILVSAGEEVYSKIINVSDTPISIAVSAGDVIFENNQSYTVTVTATMNSGLTATSTGKFTVEWGESVYDPDAGIAIDYDSYSAYISPFCLDDNGEYISDVVLSVYRREFDGSFTEIAKDVINNGAVSVTDPHPSIDYARYRIVARDNNTSMIGYSDLPGHPIKDPAIIIQWDEEWSDFSYEEDYEPEVASWTGSIVRLPYNIDVTENRNKDVSLIEYIGRRNPVGYYGTQQGESATWNTVIPKTDKDTIYALRRLSAWDGDVYVREPSGVGYWAQINVSLSIKHSELTVPVTFNITRVEGSGI